MLLVNRIKNEPALISGLLLAVFNIFAVDPTVSNQVITLVSAVLPIILSLLVRQSVDGPVTAAKKTRVIKAQGRAKD